jgi:hypothetical protein
MGVPGNTNRLFWPRKATGKVLIVLSSPPNHVKRKGKEDHPVRTTETTITFRRPFTLSALDKAQPPGTYRVVTEEEEIDGLSFVAFRRTAILMHLPALPTASATQQVINVDPLEWTAIVEADGRN